jgi:hypothetical protein
MRPIETSADTVDTADTVGVAKQTLLAICHDSTSPAAARAQAARTLLELAGALKNGGADTLTKPASEMTVSEIDARLEALETPLDHAGA